MMGKLTIKFSTSVEIERMGTFGSTMEVEMMDREGKEVLNVTHSVETLELKGAFLYCQVKFANPKHISSYSTDRLRIRFLDSHRVTQKGNQTNKLIPNWRTNYIDIPPQYIPSSISDIGATISHALHGVTYASIGISFLATCSLSLLWSMLNTLQLIVHLPLFSVVHPSNAL